MYAGFGLLKKLSILLRRDILSDILITSGLILVTYGLWQINYVIALVTLGGALIAIGGYGAKQG